MNEIRQRVFHIGGNKFAVGRVLCHSIFPRGGDGQPITFHAHKRFYRTRQRDAEESDATIQVHEMSCASRSQSRAYSFYESRQQEEIILEE